MRVLTVTPITETSSYAVTSESLAVSSVLPASDLASLRYLAGISISVLQGLYPSSLTFPGSDVYPGRGNELSSTVFGYRTLTGVPI